MTSRKRLFLAVVAVAVAFGAGGYVLGQQLESPEDARAGGGGTCAVTDRRARRSNGAVQRCRRAW